MKEQLGRNSKCHCNSGRKYKKCCLSKDQQKQAPAQGAIAGVLYGPITAGEEDDFYSRFYFQNSSIKSFVVPREKRLEYDHDYASMVQNLIEAKYSKDFSIKYIRDHLESLATGKDGLVTGHQINVTNPIDVELNMFFKDFFIRGTMATTGLIELVNKWFGYNIAFLFTDEEKKFEKGANAFKLDRNDPRFQTLSKFIQSHRVGWYADFKELRDRIEHRGYKLPQIKHRLGANGKVEAVLPSFERQTIEETLNVIWLNLSSLCEEILIAIMSFELKPPYIIWRIPEEKRAKHNWAKYKVSIPEYPEAHVSCS